MSSQLGECAYSWYVVGFKGYAGFTGYITTGISSANEIDILDTQITTD